MSAVKSVVPPPTRTAPETPFAATSSRIIAVLNFPSFGRCVKAATAAPYLANSFARVETALVGSCIIRHCAHPALCENVFYYISFARLDTR